MIGRVTFLAGTALLVSCGGPSSSPPAAGVSAAASRGPVTLSVEAAPGRVTVGERLTMTVEVVAETGVDVLMPLIEETHGPFRVRNAFTPPDVPDESGRHWTHRYELDTFDTGNLELPGVTIEYVDERPEIVAEQGNPLTGELTTDPIMVLSESVLEVDEIDARAIRGSVEVPTQGRSLLALWLGAGLAVLVAFIRIMMRRRRGAGTPSPPVPPHLRALRALDSLAARRLVEKGVFEPYYAELSGIVRQYIEDRFELRAPQRTTKEFLQESRHSDRLTEAHKVLLGEFLRFADLVKFARLKATEADATEAMAAARDFVRQTTPREIGTPIDVDRVEVAT